MGGNVERRKKNTPGLEKNVCIKIMRLVLLGDGRGSKFRQAGLLGLGLAELGLAPCGPCCPQARMGIRPSPAGEPHPAAWSGLSRLGCIHYAKSEPARVCVCVRPCVRVLDDEARGGGAEQVYEKRTQPGRNGAFVIAFGRYDVISGAASVTASRGCVCWTLHTPYVPPWQGGGRGK